MPKLYIAGGKLTAIMKKEKITPYIINVILPLSIGSFIYIIFRDKSLTVFSWIDVIGINNHVDYLRDISMTYKNILPDFILYNLPDGLWVYIGTYLFLNVWKNEKSYSKLFWVSLPLISSLLMELFQKFNIIKGTFCIMDIFSFFIFFGFAVLISLKKRRTI